MSSIFCKVQYTSTEAAVSKWDKRKQEKEQINDSCLSKRVQLVSENRSD